MLMMTVINNGEEKLSNLFVVAIALVCFPSFWWASATLLLLAVLSAMRLINRIDTLPTLVSSTVANRFWSDNSALSCRNYQMDK